VRLLSCAELLPAVPWLIPFFTLIRLGRRGPNLSDAPRAGGPMVSVIVPARNEAENIVTVVRSILASSYEPFELIVVDDRSTDATTERVRSLASDSRLRLVLGNELPAGWFGKPWACVQGYGEARGELLLFTDADTKHEPELLSRAVGALLTQQAALVTVAPRQRCVTFWERIVMPQIWFLLALRYTPQSVNRARKGRDVIANGQFILTTRQAYVAAGTHAAVRGEVAEDLALAQTYLRHGLRLHFAFAERLMETRMYRGLGDLIEGWSKNIYVGGRRSFSEEPVLRALVPVMLATALLFWLVPPAVLLASWLGGLLAHFQAAAGAAVAASAVFWILVSGGMKIPVWYGLGYPLGAVMALYITLRSTWRGTRKVEWRGRVYRQAERRGSGEAGR
jgi:chlorobactene glucosyltransferase